MRKQDLTYNEIASMIDERADKLASAVRCSTGVPPKAIKLREKIAVFLGLDPSDVWDSVFMTPRCRRSPRKMKTGRAISDRKRAEDHWASSTPSERVRSLLRGKEMQMDALAEALGLHYKTMTKAIYGLTVSDSTRHRIAEFLEEDPARIWPDLYVKASAKDRPLSESDLETPWLARLIGLGDMTIECLPPKGTIPALRA